MLKISSRILVSPQSFRLQVASPTSRFAYIEVVSPTRSESIRLHQSRFAYTSKSKCFVKMDEHHSLQLAEESYLTVFPVKFLDIIYNNYVRGHKYVLGPTQTHFSRSRLLLISLSAMKHKKKKSHLSC